MHILFVQRQPCIRALKYAEALSKKYPDIRLSFAYQGQTLSGFYGQGDDFFENWFPLGNNPAAELPKIATANGIDLIHSHNAPDRLTNLCLDLFDRNIPIIHDIHDLLSVRQTAFEDGFSSNDDPSNWWEEERRAIERSDAVITVSDEILCIARRRGYRLPGITQVFENYTPERLIPKTIPDIARSSSGRQIRIVYQGFLSNNDSHYDLRYIFQKLAAEKMEVHIYPSRDNQDYRALADSVPNIVYHPHLTPEKLLEEITQYDFGWAGFNDRLNKSHLDTVLPNKLFDYIASGLPVISFPHRALKRFLDRHRVGLVIDDISELNNKLRSPKVFTLQENVRAHRWNFTSEKNIGKIVDIYRRSYARAAIKV